MSMRPLPRAALACLAAAAATALLPRALAHGDADAWWADDPAVRAALGDAVAAELRRDLARQGTGSDKFDGEWLFGTWQMAALGFAQLAEDAPNDDDAALWLGRSATALQGVLRREVRAFTAVEWGSDPLESLHDPSAHHAAYLGYLGVSLGAYRRAAGADPDLLALHDALAAALAERMRASPTGLLETYPGEIYPVDNCAVAATVALHPEADAALLTGWLGDLDRRWTDPASGLLIQSVVPDGRPLDAPRGSGTALCAAFLQPWAPEAAAPLQRALRAQSRHVLGFGAVREYPPHHAGGSGDIDSGPVVAGIGVSPTGFSIAAARGLGDRRWFGRLLRTAWLFGAPADDGSARRFATGGSLGNAILLAMLTSPRGAS